MEQTKHRTFRRVVDNVLGVGFQMQYAGVEQISIAWPDCEARRYLADDLERNGVEELPHLAAIGGPWIATHAIDAGQLCVLNGNEITPVAPQRKRTSSIAIEPDITIEPDGTVVPTPGLEVVPDGDGGAIVVPEQPEPNTFTESQAIRDYLAEHGTDVTNKSVVAALKEKGVSVVSSQVTEIKKELAAE